MLQFEDQSIHTTTSLMTDALPEPNHQQAEKSHHDKNTGSWKYDNI
jgi:hypothetical protein